jgi:Spy/CpxP family protein refolding chaperone
LYAALNPEQRKTVVAAVRKRVADRAEREPKARSDKPEPKARAKNKLERMAKDLGLDDAQQKKLEPLLVKEISSAKDKAADREASQKRMTALLDAFEKDGFEAKKMDLSAGPDPKKMRAKMDARVALMNQITAILKPEQREKLAASMRRGRGGRLQTPMRRGGNMRAMPRMPGGPAGRRARADAISEDAIWAGPTIELPYDDAPLVPQDTMAAPPK